MCLWPNITRYYNIVVFFYYIRRNDKDVWVADPRRMPESRPKAEATAWQFAAGQALQVKDLNTVLQPFPCCKVFFLWITYSSFNISVTYLRKIFLLKVVYVACQWKLAGVYVQEKWILSHVDMLLLQKWLLWDCQLLKKCHLEDRTREKDFLLVREIIYVFRILNSYSSDQCAILITWTWCCCFSLS